MIIMPIMTPVDTYAPSTIQASTSEPFTIWDKEDTEYLVLKAGTMLKSFGLPIAGEFLEWSLMSKPERDYAVQHQGGRVLDPEQTRDKFKEMGLENAAFYKKENQNLTTYLLDKNSKAAKTLNNNKDLQDLVKQWYNDGAKAKGLVFHASNCGDTDLYLALGRARVIGLHDVGNGYVEGYVEDVYDFDIQYGKPSNENASWFQRKKNEVIEDINNMAVDLQEKGVITNYRTLIPIRIKVK